MSIVSTTWERKPLKLYVNSKVWRREEEGEPGVGYKHESPKTPIGVAVGLGGCPLAALCSSVFHN